MLRREKFQINELDLISKAEDFIRSIEQPLRLGQIVTLNSGGPKAMVVDINEGEITVSWRDKKGVVQEASFPALCLHRVSPI